MIIFKAFFFQLAHLKSPSKKICSILKYSTSVTEGRNDSVTTATGRRNSHLFFKILNDVFFSRLLYTVGSNIHFMLKGEEDVHSI